MQISVTHELQQINEHLTVLYQRLNGDLTPLMATIGALLESSTRQRFSDKKAPDCQSWEALLPTTTQAKKGRGGGILVDRGDLMKSITYHATSESVAVGTDRHYGKYHQAGTENMVARPFLGLSNEDSTNIQEMINQFIEGAFNG